MLPQIFALLLATQDAPLGVALPSADVIVAEMIALSAGGVAVIGFAIQRIGAAVAARGADQNVRLDASGRSSEDVHHRHAMPGVAARGNRDGTLLSASAFEGRHGAVDSGGWTRGAIAGGLDASANRRGCRDLLNSMVGLIWLGWRTRTVDEYSTLEGAVECKL